MCGYNPRIVIQPVVEYGTVFRIHVESPYRLSDYALYFLNHYLYITEKQQIDTSTEPTYVLSGFWQVNSFSGESKWYNNTEVDYNQLSQIVNTGLPKKFRTR